MKATSCSFEIPIQFCMRFLNKPPDIAASSPFSGFSTAEHRLSPSLHCHWPCWGVQMCPRSWASEFFFSNLSATYSKSDCPDLPTLLLHHVASPCISFFLWHVFLSFFFAVASYTFLGDAVERSLPASAGDIGSLPGSWRILWMGKYHPTPVFLPRKPHGLKSLAGCRSRRHRRVGHNLGNKH